MVRGLFLAAAFLLCVPFVGVSDHDDTSMEAIFTDVELALLAAEIEPPRFVPDVLTFAPIIDELRAVELSEHHDQVALKEVRQHGLALRPPHELRRPQPV